MKILFQTLGEEPPGKQAAPSDCIHGSPFKAPDLALDHLANLKLLVQEDRFPYYYCTLMSFIIKHQKYHMRDFLKVSKVT
jgi:hypothetical protein